MNKLLLVGLCFLTVSKLTSCNPLPHNEQDRHDHNDDQAVEVPDSVEDNSDCYDESDSAEDNSDYYDEDYEYYDENEDYDESDELTEEDWADFYGSGESPEDCDYETEGDASGESDEAAHRERPDVQTVFEGYLKLIRERHGSDKCVYPKMINHDGITWRVDEEGCITEVREISDDDVTAEDDVIGDPDNDWQTADDYITPEERLQMATPPGMETGNMSVYYVIYEGKKTYYVGNYASHSDVIAEVLAEDDVTGDSEWRVSVRERQKVLEANF